MSQLFSWGGQSTGVSALASFLPKKSQGWSHSQWTGWISLQSKGLSRVFSNTTVQKHQFFGAQFSSQCNSLIHTWLLGKTIALTRWTFVGKVMSLLSGAVKVKKKARTVQACSLLSLSSWFSGTGKKKTHSSFFPFSLATHTCHSSLVTNPTYYV